MTKKIKFSTRDELVERLRLLRYGKRSLGANSVPLLTLKAISELSGLSPSYISKLLRSTQESEGRAVDEFELSHIAHKEEESKGRLRLSNIPKGVVDWLTSSLTLHQQAGMSLDERAAAGRCKFELNGVSAYHLRQLYRRHGISLQKV